MSEQEGTIDKLFNEAKIADDGINVSFELEGYKFRFLKSGKGLMRKRRLAASICRIGSDPTDYQLDAIDAFMKGFAVTKGDDKYQINDAFTLEDFFAVVPEIVDGESVQLAIMNGLHFTAAMAILGNEQAKALLGKLGTSD